MIDPADNLVVVSGDREVVRIDVSCGVGKRQECLREVQRYGIQLADRNDIIGVRHAAGILRRHCTGRRDGDQLAAHSGLRKVALPLQGRRNHSGGTGLSEPLPRGLVSEKEKRAIMSVVVREPHGTADIASELIPVQGRNCGGKEIPRVHVVVSQEIVENAMQDIRAGLRHHADHGARVSPVDSAVAVLENGKLLKRIGIGERRRNIIVHVHVQPAVEDIGGLARARAVHAENHVGVQGDSGGGRALAHLDGAWQDSLELQGVATVQRQVIHAVRIDNVLDGGSRGIDGGDG